MGQKIGNKYDNPSFVLDKTKFYSGIGGLRKVGVQYPYTKEQLKELKKCKKDIVYFLTNYVKIISLDDGVIPFVPYKFQIKMLRNLQKNRFNIFKIARQSGKTTIVSAFFVWLSIFFLYEVSGIVAHNSRTAKETMNRIKIMYKNLPYWMMQGVTQWQEGGLEFENGSRILLSTTNENAFSGFSINNLYWDECAKVHNNMAEGFLHSVYPTISSSKKSRIIITSTPKGYNHFAKFWFDAINGISEFIPMSVLWNEVPGRDAKFKKTTISNIGLRGWSGEYLCNFVGSSKTLIDGNNLKELQHINPISTNKNGDLKLYSPINHKHNYVLVADPSEGKDQDYSAISVFDVSVKPYRQVATYKNNKMAYNLFATLIREVATMFGEDTIVAVENNNIGNSVLHVLNYELEADIFLFAEKKQLGVKSTVKTKAVGCAQLKSFIEFQLLEIVDFNTIDELYNFVEHANSFAADSGKTDDLAMTLVLFSYITTTPYFKEFTEGNKSNREEFFKDKEEALYEDLAPFGFISDGSEIKGVEEGYEILNLN